MMAAAALVRRLFFLGGFDGRGFGFLFPFEAGFGSTAALAGLFFFFGMVAAMSLFAHVRAPCFFPA
jgi:hypothetical protein